MDTDLFHLFGKSSKKVFFLFNLDTLRFDYLSEAVSKVWEADRELILETPELLTSSIHPDDKSAIYKRLEQIIKKGEGRELEISLTLPGASQKEVKVEAYPIKTEAGVITHIAGEAEDITKQSQYVNYLKEYTRRKDSTLEIIAHDLRGPLAIVKGIASLLKSEYDEEKNEELHNYTKIILNAYDNCLELIDNLLSDEHLKSPTIYVNMLRFDVVEKVRKLVDSFSVAKGVAYDFEVNCEEDKIMVELDEVKFMQIINNLVSNSLKFTKVGGNISISVKREGRKLIIAHSDNGIGIPEKLQADVFNRYNKTARKGLQGETSSGVGLSIVQDLVEIQGGSISFVSKENEGTTFFLTFPLPGE
ncbi:PAS domain-containing sensor histidine kinase [Pontibacter pamirensis]|uniref:PAS domain-containing sensor histidine kinase n=1 Tax=Pontibacter pamirensis TaxID=2562824 RepID=UPI001389792A|nr:PAS domain-containing sensor histidine kinase [Pontibacter pamirensis]